MGKNSVSMKNVLVTGGAGVIGAHLVGRLLSEGAGRGPVVDDFNDFFDPPVKRRNVEPYAGRDDFKLREADIRDRAALARVFGETKFDVIVHLAARAGVRPSLSEPVLYAETNINGTLNLLELAREHDVRQFVF